MKRFAYSLERILRLRSAQEHMRLLEFGAERKRLDEEEYKLQLFHSEAQWQQSEMRSEREVSFRVGDQNLGVKYLQRVNGVIEFQTGAVGRQRNRMESARERLTEAKRETEILKRLREKKESEWIAEMLREQTIELDEVGGRQSRREAT